MEENIEVFSDIHARYSEENVLHLPDGRDEEPFFESIRRFVTWYENRSTPSPEVRTITIFLGDIFHRPKENGFVNGLVSRLMFAVTKRSNGGKTYVLQGNHDYSKRDSSALHCLPPLGVTVIDSPRLLSVAGLTFLCLPYIYPKSLLQVDPPEISDKVLFPSVREVYSDPQSVAYFSNSDVDSVVNADHLLGHVGDETCGEFAQDCDLSWFPGEKTLGHIHKRVSRNVLGSTIITRRDEAGKKSYFKTWSRTIGWREEILPAFLDFFRVTYGSEPKKSDGETVWINDLVDCPDPDAAKTEYRQKWTDVHFGEAHRVLDKTTLVAGETSSKPGEVTNEIYQEQFFVQNQVPERVRAIMRGTLRR